LAVLAGAPGVVNAQEAEESADEEAPEEAPPQEEAPGDPRLEEARVLFERGLALVDEERWAEALEYFRRSRALAERPSSIYNAAVALYHLGRYREAVVAFDDYLALTTREEDGQRYAEAERYLEQMQRNLGRLTLTVTPPDAEIAVDGAPVSGEGEHRVLHLDPGSRNITISAEGYQTRRISLSVLEGQVHERSIALRESSDTILGIRADVDEATIYVDGVAVGRGSVELPVEPGSHDVEIEADGYHDYGEEVEVEFGALHRVDAALRPVDEERSFFSSPWPWIIGGVLVLAAAAVTIGIVVSQQSDPLQDYNGTTGVVIEGLSW
jgi:tetratricopeptide (TPR) repeat protein